METVYLNPYVSFGLAMCAIVIIAVFCTAYMAVIFNRRAKADLLAALTPLAVLIEGDVDLEEASAKGRFRGHIAEGRAANASDGPGRVFLTSIIDGAGGSAWSLTARRPKTPDAPIELTRAGFDTTLFAELETDTEIAASALLTSPGWLRIAYDPGPGHVLLTRPMTTRRDIPSVDAFKKSLELLVRIAATNRAVQHPER